MSCIHVLVSWVRSGFFGQHCHVEYCLDVIAHPHLRERNANSATRHGGHPGSGRQGAGSRASCKIPVQVRPADITDRYYCHS